MRGFYESLEKELGKPAIQVTCALATLLLTASAVFLANVEPSSSVVAACLAAASLMGFCASLWLGRRCKRREKEIEMKRRAESALRAEPDKPKSDLMGEDTLKVLRYFFYNEYDLSIEDIKLGFKLDVNAARIHLEDLQKRKYIRQTTIAGIGSDSACYALTEAGRAYAMKNMFV